MISCFSTPNNKRNNKGTKNNNNQNQQSKGNPKSGSINWTAIV